MDKTNENKLVKCLVETKAETIKLGIDQHARDVMVVQVPAEEAEQLRAHKRVRDQLQKSVQQWAARGKSLLLVQGYHVTGVWWKERAWSRPALTLPAWLVALLETIRTSLTTLWAQEQKYRAELAAQAPQDLPKAVGALTWVTLSREICDWHRFKNRRPVSSYTGLCPGVQQSGGSKRDGSINRHGNPRVRYRLIELVWRLARWQPDYPPVRKLVEGVVRGAARRKLAVAAARKLAVDLGDWPLTRLHRRNSNSASPP